MTNLISFQDPAACFVCQIPDPARVEEWVANIGQLSPKTKERHWCAMCCVRSLLLAERLDAPSVEELFDLACERGVYKEETEQGWSGAYHQELAAFLSDMHP